jgi:hypothetical protein
MIYYFDEPTYRAFWKRYPEIIWSRQRELEWAKNIGPIYHLNYFEESHDDTKAGFWGAIEGDEKHITWFLLQL